MITIVLSFKLNKRFQSRNIRHSGEKTKKTDYRLCDCQKRIRDIISNVLFAFDYIILRIEIDYKLVKKILYDFLIYRIVIIIVFPFFFFYH